MEFKYRIKWIFLQNYSNKISLSFPLIVLKELLEGKDLKYSCFQSYFHL